MNTTSNITIDFTTTNVQCYGENNGFIKAVANNGNAPYTFFWEDEAGTSVSASSPVGTNESFASNLTPGKYFIKVTDDKGCDQSGFTDVFNAYEMFVNSITQTNLNAITQASLRAITHTRLNAIFTHPPVFGLSGP